MTVTTKDLRFDISMFFEALSRGEATCTKYGLKLITANDKHYRVLKNLDMGIFHP